MSSARDQRGGLIAWLALFGSASTLICCALPSLFVLAGLGAAVATATTELPWLVTMSRHKNWVFGGAGLMIAGNFFWYYGIAPRASAANQACLPDQPEACAQVSRFGRIVLWFSTGVYLIAVFTAYVLGHILVLLDA